jgi:hypothetical protein
VGWGVGLVGGLSLHPLAPTPTHIFYFQRYSGDSYHNVIFPILFLGVPFDVISQAQKLCRYANSALEHEDVATAVKNCEQVLQLLRPYNN